MCVGVARILPFGLLLVPGRAGKSSLCIWKPGTDSARLTGSGPAAQYTGIRSVHVNGTSVTLQSKPLVSNKIPLIKNHFQVFPMWFGNFC